MKKRILAVEDSLTQREMLRHVLERRGFQTRVEANGRAALAAIPAFLPSAVITDILMPVMDGYELCQAMKRDERWRKIPVILVTGLSDPLEVVRALECGADGFIVKPYSPEKLVAQIEAAVAEGDEREALSPEEFEVNFQGRLFTLASSRRQIFNLLLSTYETAVERNGQLRAAQDQLRGLNENLEETVRGRTRALLQEVGERRKAEERLIELNQALERRASQLRRLAMLLSQTEEAERQRLAQVLHDHLQQLLVGAKMLVSVEKNRQTAEEPGEGLGRVEDLLDQSIQVSRNLTIELSPPVLRERGLVPGLEWLTRRMKEKFELNIRTELDPTANTCPEEAKLFLFQAARELLFNVFKHAGVTEAELALAREDGSMRLTVKDSGKGFDPEISMGEKHEERESFGLFSLKERAELLNGQVEIRSEAGKGTEISLVIPCALAAESVPEEERRPQ